jgi:hypothetical protein
MCIFSKPVIDVSDTKIFARRDGNMQYLAYQMNFEAKEELAMILPIPVVANSMEDVVEFKDFSKHKDLFDYLHEICQPRSMLLGSRGITKGSISLDTLKVHKVGSFEASFVPSLADFSRIDERFKLAPEIWNKIPQYKDYGFVVFKLNPTATTVHPMVFKFPMADKNQLFFPTVHIHDGQVHSLEKFNHVLYFQPDEYQLNSIPYRWTEASETPKKNFSGLLRYHNALFYYRLSGTQRNEDQWLNL